MKREGYTITDCADFYDFTHKKYSSRCGQKITRIIPHHMAGNMTPAQFYGSMHSSRDMSPTVAVFTDGTVYAYVPEELRPWTTGGNNFQHGEADKPALTLEIANDGGADTGWHISEAAYNKAVEIMADWCKRYNIDPKYTFRGPGINMHQDWESTACPGPFLKNKITSNQLERDIRKAMNPRNEKKCREFAEALYKNILKRKGDAEGLKHWTEELYSGGSSAKRATLAFFNSTEYLKKKTSNEQFIKDLYAGFMGRKPDINGQQHWLDQLESGSARNSLLDGFANSTEFKKRCSKYEL